ncbi:MAG: UvrB/UvrC motif-containing protein [Planctomycetes bacterium]|nr:UvrB/UvrC motif-containing protein [Planctomycetota bacterium]
MFCDNEATMHLTDIVNKKKREAHLCEKCAREKNLLPEEPGQPIDLKALVSLMMAPEAVPIAPTTTAVPIALNCPKCGLTYAAFKGEGRFGCAHDYEAFRSILEPLLERVHRSTTHNGKIPAVGRVAARAAKLIELRAEMSAAIGTEDYEQAARLRDLIREMEAEGTAG